MNTSTYEALKRLRNESYDEYVYRLRAMGTYTDRFRELVRKLKIKGSFHILRHTFASHLAMAGTPIPVIKKLLGHSDITTTMIYAHLAPDHLSKTVDKLKF